MATIDAIEIPKLLLAEGAAPSTPGAGLVALYAKADGNLYQKDDTGTETGLAGGGGGSAAEDITYDNGTSGLTATDVQAAIDEIVAESSSAPSAWLIDINVFPTATNTNWDTIQGTAGVLFAFEKNSTGAQNAEISWPVVLGAGTWDLELIHRTANTRGIYTIYLDASSVGTIDGYSAANTVNVRSSVTGIVVAATAKYVLKLKMETKNASSSSYTGTICAVRLVRTA